MEPAKTHAAREKARGVMRGLHLGALEEAGHARAAALEEADQQLQRIGRLLTDALDAGLTMAEIGRLTGVSRPTLYELRAKHGDTAIDANFTLLQTVALRGPLPLSALEERLGGWVEKQAAAFHERGLLEILPEPSPDGDVLVVALTPEGLDLLEQWRFHYEDLDRQADG